MKGGYSGAWSERCPWYIADPRPLPKKPAAAVVTSDAAAAAAAPPAEAPPPGAHVTATPTACFEEPTPHVQLLPSDPDSLAGVPSAQIAGTPAAQPMPPDSGNPTQSSQDRPSAARRSKRRRTDARKGRGATMNAHRTKVSPQSVVKTFDVFYAAFKHMYDLAHTRFEAPDASQVPDIGVGTAYAEALTSVLTWEGMALTPSQTAMLPSICTLMWGYVAPLSELSLRFVYDIETTQLVYFGSPPPRDIPSSHSAMEVEGGEATALQASGPVVLDALPASTPGAGDADLSAGIADVPNPAKPAKPAKHVDGLVVSGMGKLVVETLCNTGAPLNITFLSPVRKIEWDDGGCVTTTDRGLQIRSRCRPRATYSFAHISDFHTDPLASCDGDHGSLPRQPPASRIAHAHVPKSVSVYMLSDFAAA